MSTLASKFAIGQVFVGEIRVGSIPLFDAEPRLSIFTDDNVRWRGPRTRAFLNDIIGKHILNTLVSDSFGAGISAVRTATNRLSIDRKGERTNVASAAVHLPSSALDNDRTGRCFAQRSKIAGSSTVMVESTNTLANGAAVLARAAAIYVGVPGVAATACTCN